MSDPLRTDASRAEPAAPDADRDATIEHLLLVGLDQYFASDYDQAIHIWTRVLFLDRSHARARAYIERARSAQAERQREAEELLHNGLAAFDRGDASEARRLLAAAVESGAARDEISGLLQRLDQLEPARPAPSLPSLSRAAASVAGVRARTPPGLSLVAVLFIFVLAILSAGLYSAAAWGPLDWRSVLSLEPSSVRPATPSIPHDSNLPLPRRGEMALTRARALMAEGHLHDALAELDRVRPTDTERADAERLRSDIQRQLIALASAISRPTQAAVPGRTP